VGCDRVFTLKKDSVFMFDDVKYRVLSPSGSDFDFSDIFLDTVENLNIAMSNPFYTGKEKEFMRLKSQFIDRYYSCLEAFSLQSTVSSERRVHLTHLLDESLESMESLRQDMTLSPASPDIISILDNPLFRKSYSEAANAASIVFHNIREKSASYDDILMTGDVNDDIISGISGELYDSYYIVKAPHHGTQSGFSSVFKDLGISHILISNGEYHAGGEISQDYIDLKCIKHCTGNLSCKWFKASGGCCNRLLNCYDQPKGANMALKCPATQYYGEVPACMIYTVSPDGCHGCFCDNNVNF
jgi:hypothetical protein